MTDSSEFDNYAKSYDHDHAKNIRIMGESPGYFARYKITDLARVHATNAEQIGYVRTILDFGIGLGASIPHMLQKFPNSEIIGVDVSSGMLQQANEMVPTSDQGRVTLRLYDGDEIPAMSNSIDASFAACVFHHIDHDKHLGYLQEIFRVLRSGGKAMIYEHNPLNPLTRHAVNTCPFDENAVLVGRRKLVEVMKDAGFSDVTYSYRVFIPAWARWARKAEMLLKWMPLGAQYYVVGIKN